jgi:iron complex transport system ATP-binding protein
MLRVENIYYGIGKKEILQNVSATFLQGTFSMILGPNGSGKSTLLKIFSGEIHRFAGNVFYDKENISALSKSGLAKLRAVMSQQSELNFPITVEEVIMMGRYPHFNITPHKNDETICNEAMKLMNLAHFKERNYLTLSGGEKQRVQYARALAQIWETPTENPQRYLFLDEPLHSLDINYQKEFLDIAQTYAKNGATVVAVMHDINLAIQYGAHLFFIKNGKLIAQGAPRHIISQQLIKEVYDVNANIIANPVSGKPLVVF